MACNCGFHVVKPANAPQSVASVSAPGATASAQLTFRQPPLSLSTFTKSRFGGSQSASLKPHLVARKSPSSSPPSPSSFSYPSTSSVRTSMPAPSSVSTAVNTILAVGSLTGAGVHRRSRKVLDIDRYYLMVTETLRCSVCVVNFLSTSQTVWDQLDLPHQKMFWLILTQKYACDIRVIRLLRERTLGNSPARLVKQLKENHGEEWLNRNHHKGWHPAYKVPLCKRVYIAGVISSPPEQVYSRNQCTCTEFPIVPPGRPEQVEPGERGCCGDQQAGITADICWGCGPLCQHQQVFGRAFVPTFRPPAKYTGELLGVDYLLSQTGRPLRIIPDSEETENMLEDVDEGEEDEGFEEPTVPILLLDDPGISISSLPCPSATLSSSQPAASSLVASSSLAAASEQAAASTHAADSLHPCASSLTVAPSLPSLSAASSRPSASSQAPASMPQPGVSSALDSASPDESGAVDDSGMAGMDSLSGGAEKPADYGPNKPAGQDHEHPRKRGTGTVSRWDLILEDYRKIRCRILSNGTIMQQITLQLVDVSHTTLVQWHNKRVKREDNAVVLQGLVLPSRLSVASDPLPPANVRPQSAAPQPGVAYHYILPSSTVGQAK
ncbi:hypothetical protein JOQ06_000827, partial [Pogonophryne albipinna]